VSFNHNKLRHKRTDGQTDDSIMPIADRTAAVRSTKRLLHLWSRAV